MGSGIVDEAEFLEIKAANARVNSSWVLLSISIVGVSVVVVALYLVLECFLAFLY